MSGPPALAVRRVRKPVGKKVAAWAACVSIPAALGAQITADLHVPVIGIGAGPDTNGQILVLYDVLDITPGRKPRFVRNFMPGAGSNLQALKNYVQAVKKREYPAPEHNF